MRDQHIDGLRALVYFQSGLFEAAIKYALKNAIDYVNYDGHDPYLLAFAYQQVDDIESMNPLLGILRKNQKSYRAQGINNPEEDYLMAIVHILENDSAGAMTWLTRAVTAGYRPFPKLHDNVLFSSLYERLDYIELKNQLQNERDEELAKVQPYLAGYRKIISAVNLTN